MEMEVDPCVVPEDHRCQLSSSPERLDVAPGQKADDSSLLRRRLEPPPNRSPGHESTRWPFGIEEDSVKNSRAPTGTRAFTIP